MYSLMKNLLLLFKKIRTKTLYPFAFLAINTYLCSKRSKAYYIYTWLTIN